jgi:hypothetical protein
MHRLLLVRVAAIVVCAGLGTGSSAGAGEFTISLRVQAGGREQIAGSGQPAGALPVFTAKVKEVVLVQWSAVNLVSGATLSDVTLHVFMDRGATRFGASEPGPNALYESAVVLDFEPGAKSSGEFRIPMPESGSYLVRAETIGAGKKLGKEVVAAMQVSVP